MERFTTLLLDIWREACRHIEIGEAVDRMAPLLAKRLPIEWILVRKLDLAHGVVETVAAGACRSILPPSHGKAQIDAAQLESLAAWCRAGQIAGDAAEALSARLPGLLPPEVRAPVLAGPLVAPDGVTGILLLVARAGARFTDEHRALAQALLEPMAAAMENDRRLRELRVHQQRAEADKESLLTRLGRSDIADTIVGVDAGLRPVMQRVELVARSDVPVLIFGETGSGKEVVARAIHARSKRSAGPFLRVNCGAIPPDLIDSELFGHERGSFTGAVAQRLGWFERSDGGTLFMDEIGELPAAAQVRLLRILQDGTFERVGGQKTLSVDVRIVGATHRDLHAMTRTGGFREDLWYRLAVFPVHLPPLRDRVEDIPSLATHFALRAARRFGTPALVPTPEDINRLVAYAWPGNVRELASVMDRAAILGDGHSLQVAKALGAMPTSPASVPLPATTETSPALAPAERDLSSIDDAMARHITAALQRTFGRVDGPHGAARLLKINPHTLRGRMRKLGIDWKRFREPRL